MDSFTMKILCSIAFIIMCLPSFSFGFGCPNFKDLYPRTESGDSLCAIMYMDWDDDVNLSCGGEYLEAYVEEKNPDLSSHWNNKISSLVVREGCTLDAYEHSDFKGDNELFTELHHNLNDDMIHFQDWNDEITSYLCTCVFRPVDCTPTDEWHLLLACDNSDSSAAVDCTYKESHGTTIGGSFVNGGSLSNTMSETMGKEFLALFAYAEESDSLTTEYNWSLSAEFTTTMTEEVDAKISVEPGQHIGVYRIHGYCDDTVTKTQCYKFVDMFTKEVIKMEC